MPRPLVSLGRLNRPSLARRCSCGSLWLGGHSETWGAPPSFLLAAARGRSILISGPVGDMLRTVRMCCTWFHGIRNKRTRLRRSPPGKRDHGLLLWRPEIVTGREPSGRHSDPSSRKRQRLSTLSPTTTTMPASIIQGRLVIMTETKLAKAPRSRVNDSQIGL